MYIYIHTYIGAYNASKGYRRIYDIYINICIYYVLTLSLGLLRYPHLFSYKRARLSDLARTEIVMVIELVWGLEKNTSS